MDRDVTMQLKTRAEGDVAEPLEKLSRATKAAAEEERKYQQALKGRAGLADQLSRQRGGGHAGHLGGAGGGGASGGGPLGGGIGKIVDAISSLKGGAGGAAGKAGGAAGMAGIAGSAIAGTKAITSFLGGPVADMLNIAQDPRLSEGQRNQKMMESIPIIGGMIESMRKFDQAASGVTRSLIEMKLASDIALADIARGTRLSLAQDAGDARVGGAETRARALGAVGVTPARAIDRGTFQGDIAYQQQQRLLPLQDAQSRAVAESSAAEKSLRDSRSRLAKLEGNRERLMGSMSEARIAEEKKFRQEGRGPLNSGTFSGGASTNLDPVGRTGASLAALNAEEKVLANEQRIKQENARMDQLGLTAAEKESAVRKAGIAIEKERLSILQAQEQRLVAQSRGVGALNPMQRAMGLQAALLIKKGGIGSVTPEMRGLAEQFAPQFVGKELEKHGKTTEEYKRGVKEGVLEEGDVGKVREQIQKTETNVRVEVNLDEAALGKRIAAEVSRSVKELIASVKAEVEAEKAKKRSGQQLQNASLR